jgi:hypothetical protein
MKLLAKSTFHNTTTAIIGILIAFLLLIAARNASAAPAFTNVNVFFEFNATAQDIGVQLFFDAGGWKNVSITGPDGKIFNVNGSGNLGLIGLTEASLESEEPSLGEVPLPQFLALFPEGKYKFSGETVDGQKMQRTDTLTHMIPDGANIVSPAEDAVVDPGDTIIDWIPVTTPAGIQIISYEVIVERDNPLRTYSVDVSPSVTEVHVPSEFLDPNTIYKFEVLAIEVSGNRTLTESTFQTP